jgi:hypothetical protein
MGFFGIVMVIGETSNNLVIYFCHDDHCATGSPGDVSQFGAIPPQILRKTYTFEKWFVSSHRKVRNRLVI